MLMALKVGDVAPDFKLPCTTGEKSGEFQLSSYRGKNVVLVFYPLDFTPV
jgi:peroxiredoxin